MIKEYQAFITAFQEGKELANSKIWKNRQIATNHVIALVSAAAVISQAFGYYVPVDESQLNEIMTGGFALVAMFNTIMTYVTSAKVGVKKKEGV